MKNFYKFAAVAFLLSVVGQPSTAFAATTINPTNSFAYGANIGWINWRGDTNNGTIIGEYVCSGYIYSANVGWINLGSGSPVNGIQYQNNSASDFGVNHDGSGNLTGYAYGANIGWIAFEGNGAPKVDLQTGKLSGSIYSANCGWISLSNAMAFVQTVNIPAGVDSDGDGIADAWERLNFGNLTTATGSSDSDGDGVSDKNEYLAGTNPLDVNDYLHITFYSRGNPTPTYNYMVWSAKPNRYYVVQASTNLVTMPFTDFFGGMGWNNIGFDRYSSLEFYRVRAYRPLTP